MTDTTRRDLTPGQQQMLRTITAASKTNLPPKQEPEPPQEPAGPTISDALVQQAPAKMPEIVRSMHHTAAQSLEDAASMLEHEMQSHVQLMRDEADQLRIQGDGQAATIEMLSALIRETHNTFKVQAERLTRFRTGQLNGEKQ